MIFITSKTPCRSTVHPSDDGLVGLCQVRAMQQWHRYRYRPYYRVPAMVWWRAALSIEWCFMNFSTCNIKEGCGASFFLSDLIVLSNATSLEQFFLVLSYISPAQIPTRLRHRLTRESPRIPPLAPLPRHSCACGSVPPSLAGSAASGYTPRRPQLSKASRRHRS